MVCGMEPERETSKKAKKRFRGRKPWQRALIVVGWSLLGVVLLSLGTVGGYVIYVSHQYYRIGDNYDLTSSIYRAKGAKDSTAITKDTKLSLLTYNIGFGAYDHEYSFFMDTGKTKSGKEITGKYAKAISKEHTQKNTEGALTAVKKEDADFVFLQEIDRWGERSYHIDQYAAFRKGLPSSEAVYASNFHSAYLAYPLNDPIGSIQSGLVTFSKYEIAAATRRSYPVDPSFPTKFFDLDRCFSISRLPLSNGKELVLANSHMSAYDKGGKIRKKQLTLLTSFMQEEKDKGNYVIVGGDFNHDLCGSAGKFESDEVRPDWVASLSQDDLPEGYSIVSNWYGSDGKTMVPTCRAAELPYTRITKEDGTSYLSNYTVVIDGFLVSDNVNVLSNYNIDLDFLYSDHNPARMEFSLDL